MREVKDPGTRGIFRSLNEVYPIGAHKPNSATWVRSSGSPRPARAWSSCKSRGTFRFFSQDQIRRLELPGNMAVVKPSPYTHNIVGYWERPEDELRVYALGISGIRDDVHGAYRRPRRPRSGSASTDLLLPIDHLATRVYSQNREAAILE